jgi:hypothetical protein
VSRVAIAGSHVTCTVSEPEHVTLDDGTKAIQIQADFEIAKDAPKGWLDRNIVFETSISSEDGSEMIDHPVRFHVSGQVGGKIQISPERMSFGTPAPGTEISREIRLYGLTEDTFNITSVRFETQSAVELNLTSDTVEVNKKAVPRVVVKGVAPEEKGSFSGNVIITTDLPGEDELIVSFFGSVRAPLNRPIFQNQDNGGAAGNPGTAAAGASTAKSDDDSDGN